MVQQVKRRGVKRRVAGALVVLLLAGCATRPNNAPIEDRTIGARAQAAAAVPGVAVAADPGTPLPGAENAGKAGYYTVKSGDTLIRIGLDNGQNWKDLVQWNKLDNPNVIEVGQVLRVVPPGADPNGAATRPVAAPKVETRPLDVRVATASSTAAPVIASLPPAESAAPPAPLQAREGDDNIAWSWPAAGTVKTPFQEGKAKGLDISGKAGEPVLAAADGRVVYAGSGLRGYGNLVILKHNSTYLSAYAHNQVLLVKEDQSVRRGQKIAEMGSTDADGVQLHFEIRKQGKPIDPARLLPPR
jgi:lipoprotein NlpD